jgi:hypothetical protein
MPYSDCLIVMYVGGFFVLLGIIFILWGKGEERRYYKSTATRADVREFLERWPKRPRVGAVKIGGWIALAIGLVTAAAGGAFWLWG